MIPLETGQMATGIGRRQFISTLGSAAVAWPLVARAQQASGVAQIGFLYPGVAAMAVPRIAALREGLQAVGYKDADQVKILARSSGGAPAQLAPFAADLVERKVDVIVAVSPSAVRAAKSATAIIPIVAADLERDRVGTVFVASVQL